MTQAARNIPALSVLLGLCLLVGCSDANDAGDIRVHDARVRQLLPGQLPGEGKTAAYLDLTNTGPAAVTLVQARSDHARSIEIHQTSRQGDLLSMRRVDSVRVAGKETVRLAPGGLHLMLFGVDNLPSSIEIELFWAHGEIIRVPFRQISIGAQ